MRNVALLLLVACGSSSSPGKPGDAPPDMPPDLAPTPDAPAGHVYYVVDHENIPMNSTQARAYALDLDNDGQVDNQFGMVLATLSSQGFDVQTSVTASIAAGQTLLLVDLYALDFTTTTGSTFTTYDGESAGPGMYKIASTSPHDTPLAGSATAGTFTEGPGHIEIQGAFFVPDHVVKLDLIGARVKLTGASATTLGTSIIAGGISMTEINGNLLPGWQASATAEIQHDCCGLSTSPGGATCTPPTCGCVDGSSGKTALGLFDANHDCAVSLPEIQNNSLVMSLLAPDVMVEGQMALSFGMQVTGAHALLY